MPLSRTYSVLIVDDHALIRTSIRCMLAGEKSVCVIGEAGDGAKAIEEIVRLQPDVAVVDVAMPNLDGVGVARRVADLNVNTRTLILTATESFEVAQTVLEAGAHGYLPKSATATDLMTAIRVVADGNIYVHESVLNRLITSLKTAEEAEACGLSLREAEVLRLNALGFCAKEIAARISISRKSVETYKARAVVKIGARSRADIVRYAIGRGWMRLTPK